jgi:hypothetical protein
VPGEWDTETENWLRWARAPGFDAYAVALEAAGFAIEVIRDSAPSSDRGAKWRSILG